MSLLSLRSQVKYAGRRDAETKERRGRTRQRESARYRLGGQKESSSSAKAWQKAETKNRRMEKAETNRGQSVSKFVKARALVTGRAAAALGVRIQTWQNRRAQAVKEVEAAEDAFAKFVDEIQQSTDACSVRLHSSSVTLHHLVARAKTLGAELEAHQKTVVSETENLNATEAAIREADGTFAEQQSICEQARQEAEQQLTQFRAELVELEQIANPQVRAVVAQAAEPLQTEPTTLLLQRASALSEKQQRQKTKAATDEKKEGVTAETTTAATPPGKAADKKTAPWTHQQCHAFLAWSRKARGLEEAARERREGHEQQPALLELRQQQRQRVAPGANDTVVDETVAADAAAAPPPPSDEECTVLNLDLQTKFTDAHTEINKIIAIKEVESSATNMQETCVGPASAEHVAELSDLNPQREHASDKIEESSSAIAGLVPATETLLQNQLKLEHQIQLLTTECTDQAEVSSYLRIVRELIIETSKCPGIDSFKMDVPLEGCTALSGAAMDFSANTACKDTFGGTENPCNGRCPGREWKDLTGNYWLDAQSKVHASDHGGGFIFSNERGTVVTPQFHIGPQYVPKLSVAVWARTINAPRTPVPWQECTGNCAYLAGAWLLAGDCPGEDCFQRCASLGSFSHRDSMYPVPRLEIGLSSQYALSSHQSNLDVPGDEMFHAVFIWDGAVDEASKKTIYLNGGTLAGGKQQEFAFGNASPSETVLALGGPQNALPPSWAATMEIFRFTVYQAALTADEVQDLYHSTRPAELAP